MRKILYILLACIPPTLLFLWSARADRELSNGWLLLTMLPLAWLSFRDTVAGDEDDAPPSPFAILLLAGCSVFAIVIGGAAWAIRGQGSQLEVMAFLFPVGVAGLLFALARLFFGSR